MPDNKNTMVLDDSMFIKGMKLLKRRDGDRFDSLSNRYSVGLLIMMAVFSSTITFVKVPIECYTPKEFKEQWTKYTNNYCWVSNTYYVPMDKRLPTESPIRNVPGAPTNYSQEITYYQWVPIVLTLCAAMFAVPARIWAWASNSGGYDVQAMVKATAGTDNLNPEVRDKTIAYLVNQMDRLLGYRRPIKKSGLRKVQPPIGKRFGHFLFIAYMIAKCLYIGNAVLQLFVLNAVLGGDYYYYGIDVLRAIQDPNFQGSQRFPYVTMCDFWIRRMGENKHKYTVQCVLPFNLINEKVFIVLWFWLVFVAAASMIGLIVWLFTLIPAVNHNFAKKYLTIMGRINRIWLFTLIPAVNHNFAKKYLTIMGRINRSDPDDLVDDFVSDYLRMDGMFVMRLLIKNTNDVIGGEIMSALWDRFMQRRKPHFDPTADDLLPRRQGDEEI